MWSKLVTIYFINKFLSLLFFYCSVFEGRKKNNKKEDRLEHSIDRR